MFSSSRTREGFALATAIVAIVLIGLLIAASFFGSIQEYRTGRNTIYQERALAAAEFGQNHFLTDFVVDDLRRMTKGQIVKEKYDVQDGAVATVDVTKLNMLTFQVVSEGIVAEGTDTEARRRTGMLLRLEIPELPIKGAITSLGTTNITGTGAASGADLNPANWNCDDPGPTKAGIVVDNTADATSQGACGGFSCVTGSPKVAVDPLAGDPATYEEFGGFSYDSLAKMANIVLSPGDVSGIGPVVSGGACQTVGQPKNWGDVNRNLASPGPCESYFPIIHVKGPGTFSLSTGKGQGILLVDGNLKMAGQVEFYGPVIVKGNLTFSGTGNKIFGGVMTANQGCASNPCNAISGNAAVQYSRCSLLAALISRARPVLATRSWADMF